MHARQVVTGDVEQQMMLEMVVHVIRSDEETLEEARMRGACIAQGIAGVGHDGVLKAGDRFTVKVQGVGELTNPVHDEE